MARNYKEDPIMAVIFGVKVSVDGARVVDTVSETVEIKVPNHLNNISIITLHCISCC